MKKGENLEFGNLASTQCLNFLVKFPLKIFYNIGAISENLEFPHFCLDFLQKSFITLTPGFKIANEEPSSAWWLYWFQIKAIMFCFEKICASKINTI